MAPGSVSVGSKVGTVNMSGCSLYWKRRTPGGGAMGAADAGVRVIDADTHLTEPPDLWTARMPERFRGLAPQVRFHEPSGTWRWTVGERWCSLVGNYSMAG